MKKIFITRLAATFIAAVVLCHSTFAAVPASISATVKFDKKNSLTIYIEDAQFNSVEGFLTVVITPPEVDFSEFPSGNVVYNTVSGNTETGTGEVSLIMPSEFDSGRYYIRSFDDKGEYLNILGYVNDTDRTIENKVELMNAQMETEAVEYLFSNSSKTFGEMLRIYSPNLGFDKVETYNNLSDAEKKEIEGLAIKSSSLKTMGFDNAFKDMVNTARFKCAADHEILGEDYLAYATANSISLEQYNGLSDYSKDCVFLLMEDSIENALCMEEVNNAFSSAVTKEAENPSVPPVIETKPTPNPGGGGVSVPPAETPLPEKQQDHEQKPEGNAAFSDISGHWAEDYITKMKAQGIISGIGNGQFAPDRSVTRAEFVKMICVMSNVSGGAGSVFTDVKADDWYYSYVNAAYSAGLINGVGDGEFAPQSPISREDAAVIIARLVKDKPKANLISFTDEENISDYAKEAVALLTAMGVVKGDDKGRFNPQNSISRAETAALLVRIQESTE